MRITGKDMRTPNSERDHLNPEWFWMALIAKALKLSNYVPLFPSILQINGWGVTSVLDVKSLLSWVVVFVKQNLELTLQSQMPDTFYLSPGFQRLMARWLQTHHPIMAWQVNIYIRWLTDRHDYVIDMTT